MKGNLENFSENILQNIADDLSTINGTCTEIKESQLNCATADDLNNMGASITSAVTEKVDEMQTSIDTQTQAVSEIGNNLTTEVNDLKTEITNKIDDFTANPRYRRLKRPSASPRNHGKSISPCSSRCSPSSSSELPLSGKSRASNEPVSPTSSITTS